MPRGIDYRVAAPCLDQIDMIDRIECMMELNEGLLPRTEILKKELLSYSSELHTVNDVQALLKTLFHFM